MRRAVPMLLLAAACGAGEILEDEYLDPDAAAGEGRDAGKVPGARDAGGKDAASEGPDASVSPGPDAGRPDAALPPDAGMPPDAGVPPCPAGVTCVEDFPFHEARDTSQSSRRQLAEYSCAPSIDEGGPEIVYRVTVPEAGFLSAAVEEDSGTDVDVHILSALSESACLDRGNYHASADVTPGVWYVVIDTYVSGSDEKSGPFRVDIGLTVPSIGPCGMQVGEMPRVNDGGNHLQMPATGKVVLEAHLVTQEEPPPYPSTETEELSAHYALSQSRTGFVMHRKEPWAPLEGGTFYGCGIGSPSLFPVVDEGWYVNMYWTSSARPARGTRMILRVPGTSRAVVVAAGYETGPGDLSWIGGTTEEPHYYLGGSASQPWKLGIAVDQSMPFGPRVCTD